MREKGVREEMKEERIYILVQVALYANIQMNTCTHTHLTYRVGEGLLLCLPSQTGQWDDKESEQWWTGTGNRRSFRT